MNGKRVMLAGIKGSPSTSSNLFQAATMNRSYRTNDTNDNPSVWMCLDTSKAHFRTLSLCMSDRCLNLLDFQWHQYVSWRSFAYSNITICHCTPSKPHSTSMVSLVVLTRTGLNMLNWEFLNSNIVYNGCKTYHVRGKACFSMVFNGFQLFSAWWHCSSSWSAFVPPTSASGPFTSEDVSGATELTLSSSL